MPRSVSLAALILAVLSLSPSGLCAQAPSPGGEPAFRATLNSPTAEVLAAQLQSLGYDVHAHGGELDLVLSEDEEEALQTAGLNPVRGEAAMSLRARLSRGDVVPQGYRDLAAITAALQALAASHPQLVTFHDAALEWGPGATHEGRAIPVIKISDHAPTDEDEPEVLFVSGHHCREIITPEIALGLAELLVNGYATDPRIQAIVDGHEIWIAPIWNPDGLEYVWNVNELWRKNRRPVGGGAVGVDLNRNYPFGWNSGCGGSTNPSNSTYRGPSASSEAETQTMIAWSNDRRFAKVMDYHSTGREVLLGYLCSSLPAPMSAFIDAEGTLLAQAIATPPGYATRRPSAEGEHQVWQIAEHTSYSFLTETGTEFQPSYALAQAEVQLVIPSALAFLERAVPFTGRVLDAANHAPIEATFTVQGLAWLNGELRRSEPRFGRFHLFLPAGTWTITAQAPGYAAETATVTIGATGTTSLDFLLRPPFVLDATTSGNGDLLVALSGIQPAAASGYTLVSLDQSLPLGQGPLFGISPDRTTFEIALGRPATPGDLFHWTWPVAAGLFPASPIALPQGSVPQGLALDAVALAIPANFLGFQVSAPVRLQF